MAASWTRVWGPVIMNWGQGCPSSCYNFTSGQTNQSGNPLDEFSSSVQTVGQVVGHFATVIQSRLSAQSVVVSSISTNGFQLDIRLTPKKTAVVTLNFMASSGNYPVRAAYQMGSATGTSSFVELTQLLEWLAVSLS